MLTKGMKIQLISQLQELSRQSIRKISTRVRGHEKNAPGKARQHYFPSVLFRFFVNTVILIAPGKINFTDSTWFRIRRACACPIDFRRRLHLHIVPRVLKQLAMWRVPLDNFVK